MTLCHRSPFICQKNQNNLKNDQWIEQLSSIVSGKVRDILGIWDEIGLEDKNYKQRKEILKGHIIELLDNMASEEKNSVAALRAAVNKSEADVCRLETILNVKHQPVERHLPLVERERQLSEMSMLLSTTLSNRIDCFNALIEEQQRLGKQLGESVRGYTYETAPSLSLLQVIENEISELRQRVARNSIKSSGQHAYVGDVRTSSSSIPLNRVLPNPPDSDCGDKNFSAHKDGTAKSGESLVTKNSDNQTVAERVAAFRNAYLHSDAEHENSVKAIFISRLSELHKLFDECLVDYKIRERYPKQPADISLSSDYLDHIEEQIAKWQDYRTLHTDVMAAFFSWRASFARLLHIESQINDPKMRLRRSSLFLRLEKEAASVKERILPNLEKQLFVAADKDEGFLVFGVPVQQYVEEARREADQAEPGRPGLNPEKQAQLIPKDTSAARSPPRAGPPPAKKPRPSLRATSRVPTQSPSPHRPGLAKVAPIPKGRPLTQVASRPPAPGLSTPSSSRPVRTKGISDRNQSASKIACPPTPNNNAKLATPIGRPPTARKVSLTLVLPIIFC
uniref:Protein regulator of cytokinesis 1 n=1 Tax=Mesocestoides corti TaxID=53468 RepID=A0A5K3EPD4_MESCO